MQCQLPDFTALPLPELRAWAQAIAAAIGAHEALGGGDIAILSDGECVSVIITIDLPERAND